MKKLFFTLAILMTLQAIAIEQNPILLDTKAINMNYQQDEQSEINVDNMKKSEKIKQVQKNMEQKNKPKIKIDTRQMQHEKMLDYSTKQQNMMLPIF